MRAEGIIASKVKTIQKGTMFKVTIPDMGDTFPIFINPEDRVKGIELLQLGDKVSVEWDGVFSSKDTVRLDGVKVSPSAAAVRSVSKAV